MITAIALSPALDVTYVVDRLDGIQRPIDVVRVGGGKALNAARAARALGAPDVRAVAVLAGGAGADVAASVRGAGVRLRAIDGSKPTRTCVSMFARDTGRLTEIYERAVALRGEEIDAVTAGLAEDADGWVLMSGGLPLSAATDTVERIVRAVQRRGARIAIDTHGDALRAAVRAGPDIVKVNRQEAAELLGCDPALAGRELVSRLRAEVDQRDGRERIAVMTDGAHGSWASDGRSILHAEPATVVGDFPVGSGDSFLAGLVVALDARRPLAEALALAGAAGAANARVPGAGVFDPALAHRLAADALIRVEAVAS